MEGGMVEYFCKACRMLGSVGRVEDRPREEVMEYVGGGKEDFSASDREDVSSTGEGSSSCIPVWVGLRSRGGGGLTVDIVGARIWCRERPY
jgi:hypothetical protein